MKTTSRFAIAAVAGLAFGGLATTGAKAADLGGNCCADLEERVAELEATTARKGNRVVTLTISGHVNRGLLAFDDDGNSDVYVVGNANSRSRFRFAGEGKINADWKAGYYIEIGINDTQTTDVTQANDNGAETGISMRHDYWYLESKTFGRITLGHTTGAADGTDVVDLGDLGVVTSAETYLHSGGLLLFNKGTGAYLPFTWTQALTGGVDPARGDLVKYDSPTLHGFQFSASWGEDDTWAVALRYAKEFNGLRVAAAIGYIEDTDENGGQLGAVNPVAYAGVFTPNGDRDIRRLQVSASLWHVPSGIFVSGSYTHTEYHGTFDRDIAGIAVVPGLTRPDADYWWIGFGLRKNWFGIGTTAIYGEYAEGEGQLDGSSFDGAALTLRITDHSSRLWGIGIVQNIDSIASELYIGYRHHEVDLSTQTVAQFLAGTSTKQNISDMDAVLAGIKIKF